VTARISATASGPGKAEIRRSSVLRINPAAPQDLVLLERGESID
jgi:hypothetical protein